jgi:transcriptional regulator with XRE-family HTH domain
MRRLVGRNVRRLREKKRLTQEECHFWEITRCALSSRAPRRRDKMASVVTVSRRQLLPLGGPLSREGR